MSRSAIRPLLIGAVAGFLIGGLTAVVTPAGAALTTDWAKIFKQEIKPRADERYVTKAAAAKTFAPRPRVIRGTFVVNDDAARQGDTLTASISFGYAVGPAPKVAYVRYGGTLPVGCSGDWENPNAARGYLCVFEARHDNVQATEILSPDGTNSGAGPTGAVILTHVVATEAAMLSGSWAVRPASISGQ